MRHKQASVYFHDGDLDWIDSRAAKRKELDSKTQGSPAGYGRGRVIHELIEKMKQEEAPKK
jgi:hypothetical protein